MVRAGSVQHLGGLGNSGVIGGDGMYSFSTLMMTAIVFEMVVTRSCLPRKSPPAVQLSPCGFGGAIRVGLFHRKALKDVSNFSCLHQQFRYFFRSFTARSAALML